MADRSLNAGAEAILPEEPLAHVFTGYEESFRELWMQRYGIPWQPQHSSDVARYLTAQLKNELYLKLEQRLGEQTQAYERGVAFVLPIHSLYSNIAAQLVAPLGTSTNIPGVDGYIGQIWTGPVNWALSNYDSPRKSFFTSAYVLYDYFTQLTVASDRKLWLLVDPVEDDPHHTWLEFAQWYQHCIAAMLLMDEVDSYEIMPWPDRIFLSGHSTGGGTPAPEDYRVTILAVTQALQEMPLGGTRFTGTWPDGVAAPSVPTPIGVAMADTLMWQRQKHPMLQGVYALFLPLLERGIPVSSFVMERAGEPAYLSRFKLIVLSYEDFKPADPSIHAALVDWVKTGGVLILLGGRGDALDTWPESWWRRRGADSALQALLDELGATAPSEGTWPVGDGWVLRRSVSPKEFAQPDVAEQTYLPLIRQAWEKAGQDQAGESGSFCMQRGPFVVAHAETETLHLRGRLIDIFDPNLCLKDSIGLAPGSSGLYRDVADLMDGDGPTVLHTTHRLASCERRDGALRFVLRGPAQTPGVARVFIPKDDSLVTAKNSQGESVDVACDRDGDTTLLTFANDPAGVTVEVRQTPLP